MHSLEGVSTEAEILAALSGSKSTAPEIQSLYQYYTVKMGRGEVTEAEFWKGLCGELGVEVPDDSSELWRKGIRACLPYMQMFDLVTELKVKGYQVCVLSNSIPPHAEIIKEKGWYDSFDRVFLSHEVGMRKPDKAIYEYLLEVIEAMPAECLFIDDLPENILSAKELGMETILAENPDQVIEDVKRILAL